MKNFKAIKACIFDLDGVIVDTAHYHFLAWKRLAAELGIELTLDDNEKLKGVSRMDSLDIILKKGSVEMAQPERVALADKKNGWFVEYIEQMKADEIFPGVEHLIRTLKQNGIKVALASSSKNAPRVLQLLKIENLFDAVVHGGMITHSKPHPEIFETAAAMLKVSPAHCLVFEDAEAGVEAALNAGMPAVGIGSPTVLTNADMVVQKTADFDLSLLQLQPA